MSSCEKTVGDRVFIRVGYEAIEIDAEGNETLTPVNPVSVVARLDSPAGTSPISVTMSNQYPGVFEGSYIIDAEGYWRGTVEAVGGIDRSDNFSFRAIRQKVPA